MTDADVAARRELTGNLRAAAEARTRTEPAAELVPDANGGDLINYGDEQEGDPRATQHRGH